MKIKIGANRAQLSGLLLNPRLHVSVEGRATGKSFDIGFTIDRIVRQMPRSVTAITGKTIGQLLTRTLPSAFKLLNSMGYADGINYVIGKRPPPHFISSYEQINKHDNFISFSGGAKFALISQYEKDSGRGANFDFEIVDEALTIDIEQYNREIAPANRGNLEHFGKHGHSPVAWHHGAKYSTSMPTGKTGKWLLKYADYYEEERGINLFKTWNRIANLQCELLDIDNAAQFAELWNEIERVRKKISPFVSKDGVLFTIANAFDNLKWVGLNYIKSLRESCTNLEFMSEVMNVYFEKIEDCFYALSEQKHIYYTHYDNEKIREAAIKSGFDFDLLSAQNSQYDRDCNSSLPLEIVGDWGVSINLFCVCQERNYDFVTETVSQTPCFNFINEFFVKPDTSKNILIEDLCAQFTKYYRHHQNRNLIYYRDRYGDHRNPNVINSMSYNEHAITVLTRQGWRVEERVHKGIEPPQSDKYLLWGKLLREGDDTLPRIRFNGEKCRYTLISMNNTKVVDKEEKFAKDKSSERKSSGIAPEEATHFSDAADKIIWTKYGEFVKGKRDDFFIPTRFSS